ncbi:MAG: conjugative transposon protein TraM [Tannerella sp.]|nr:conjugative transposon protein TraM [Tannerella sp.]
MIVLMALPVVLGGMFVISRNIQKEQAPVSDDSLIIPDVSDVEGNDDDKAKIYRDEQIEMMHKRSNDARNIASDKDFYAIDPDLDKEEKKTDLQADQETQQVLAQYRDTYPETKTETPVSQPKVQNQSRDNNIQSNRVNSPSYSQNSDPVTHSEERKSQETVPDDKPKRRSSMGIYTADRVSSDYPTGKMMAQSKKYLKAILEEDKTIQNGSNVIFVLSEDGNIEGTQHKRGSILYGRATQGREFFEVNIYQVKSANDGNTYPADLIVFDENYNRGIRSEGFLNEVSKEEGTDAATETIDEVTRGATSVKALDLATRAITRTVSRTARSKPISIPLRKGYKVYLQPKTKEK